MFYYMTFGKKLLHIMSKFKTRNLEETFVLSKGYLSVECQFEQKQHNNVSLDSIVQL